MLYVVFLDKKIKWHEGAYLVGGYFIYVGFMTVNSKVFEKMDQWAGTGPKEEPTDKEMHAMHDNALYNKNAEMEDKFGRTVRVNVLVHGFIRRAKARAKVGSSDYPQIRGISYSVANPFLNQSQDVEQNNQQLVPYPTKDIVAVGENGEMKNSAIVKSEQGYAASLVLGSEHLMSNPAQRQIQVQEKPPPTPEEDEENEEEGAENPFEYPADGSALDKFTWAAAYPFYFMFSITIPDSKQEKWKAWYPLTFVMSILWIGVLTYFMVDFTNRIGCVLGVPPVIMGVTVLAAGTSIPDALGSIAVAKEGHGDMAVSNAIGSNVFDILVGMGVPWLLVCLIEGKEIEPGVDEL
eukprot:gene3613-4543_t